MQPVTIRRLLVFGVCLVGVGCLYLLPSMAGSPVSGGSTPARQGSTTVREPTDAGRGPVTDTDPSGSPARLTPAPTIPDGPVRMATVAGSGAKAVVGTDRGRQGPVATNRAAVAGSADRDDIPPSAVAQLRLQESDSERLIIAWPDATDDVGVLTYRVWLNGFLVMSTQQTWATLAWFNDSSTHVVQVRAVDESGNVGPASPTLMVTRPAPVVEAPPAPSPSASAPIPPSASASTSPAEDADRAPAASQPAAPQSDETTSASPPTTVEGATEEDGS